MDNCHYGPKNTYPTTLVHLLHLQKALQRPRDDGLKGLKEMPKLNQFIQIQFCHSALCRVTRRNKKKLFLNTKIIYFFIDSDSKDSSLDSGTENFRRYARRDTSSIKRVCLFFYMYFLINLCNSFVYSTNYTKNNCRKVISRCVRKIICKQVKRFVFY